MTVDSGGYSDQDGERLIPVGVNYWPAACGVEVMPGAAIIVARDQDAPRSYWCTSMGQGE